MKHFLIFSFIIFFGFHGFSQKTIEISGRVTDGKSALADVQITVKDTDRSFFTDDNGRYRIEIRPRKALIFSYTGMKSVEYWTEDVDAVVNIELYPEVEELDEVVVERRRKTFKELEAEYDINKNLIKTYFGILDKERSTFAMTIVDGDDLSMAGIDFIGALQNHVPAMRVSRPPGDPTSPVVFLPRRFNSLGNPRPVAYDVDGILMTEPPTEILPANIKRIAVVNSAGALVRYGQIAAGGVIIINTRGGVFDPLGRSNRNRDQARLRNNIFDERELVSIDKVPQHRYVEALYNFDSKEEADQFMADKKLPQSVSAFNGIEIAEYYVKRWDDMERFREILSLLEERNADNPIVLKTIAFHLEAYDLNEEALALYRKIFKLRPGYAQSYRDLAHINSRLGNHKRAFELLSRYIRYRDLENSPLPAMGIDSILLTEYDQLLAKQDDSKQRSEAAKYTDETVRLVFEWSHSDADFILQFVNPEDRFFNWTHSSELDPDQIKREKQLGYSSEQFFIGQGMPGKWQVNMKYDGNKSYDPTYLKLSVYYNYGTAFEREEIHLFRLAQKDVKYRLHSLVNNPMAASSLR